MGMNLLDWVLIGIALFSAFRGISRGAVSQIFGIAGILGGFYVASHHYGAVSAQLTGTFPGLAWADTISFIALFMLTWMCVAIVGFWTAKILRKAGLGFFDRLWGGMIGFGKALVFSIIAVSFLMLFASTESGLLKESVLVPYIQEASRILLKMAPEKVQKEYDLKLRELERLLSGKKPAEAGHGPGKEARPEPGSKKP